MAMHSRFYTIVALLALMLGHAAAVDVRVFEAVGGGGTARVNTATPEDSIDCAALRHGLASRARYLDRLGEGEWPSAAVRGATTGCGSSPLEDGRLARHEEDW